MTIEMLVFDFRDTEKPFFNNNELQNFNFTFFEESLNPQTVKNIPEEVRDKTTVISVFTDSDITKEVIREFKNLRIISTRSTYYDHISKSAATERNIAVINVTNYGETSAAQFTFALILCLTRKIIPASEEKEARRRSALWTGRDLAGMSIGIVGTGPIEASVCKIAKAFDMKIYGYDANPKYELIEKYGLEYLPLSELIENSDIISLHTEYTGENFHMFSDAEFNLMKKDSYFINISSKKLVNLESLYNALKNGKICGAALDTTCCEYHNSQCFINDDRTNICIHEDKYLAALRGLKNVIITPRIAYNTEEAINYMLQNTIDQIRETIKGGDVYGVY